jgi:hypothetical protein
VSDDHERPEVRLRRRAFLSRSVLASGALVAGPIAAAAQGCGASFAGAMSHSDARELLERLERGLGRIRDVPRGEIASQLSWLARPDVGESVLRATVEALVVMDVARSLPEGADVPRALADRLADELPVLGASTDLHHGLLARMPLPARRSLDTRLRAEPDLPMEVAGWIDRHARELGTSADSRAQLRYTSRDVRARLTRQSSGAVIDDCISKVERAAARGGCKLALDRSTASAKVFDAIWQEAEGGTTLAAPPLVPPAPPPAPTSNGGPSPLEVPQPSQPSQADLIAAQFADDQAWAAFTDNSHRFWSARWQRPGDPEVRTGGVLMALGPISCGVTLIVGLIVLISGAVQNSRWNGVPRGDR